MHNAKCPLKSNALRYVPGNTESTCSLHPPVGLYLGFQASFCCLVSPCCEGSPLSCTALASLSAAWKYSELGLSGVLQKRKSAADPQHSAQRLEHRKGFLPLLEALGETLFHLQDLPQVGPAPLSTWPQHLRISTSCQTHSHLNTPNPLPPPYLSWCCPSQSLCLSFIHLPTTSKLPHNTLAYLTEHKDIHSPTPENVHCHNATIKIRKSTQKPSCHRITAPSSTLPTAFTMLFVSPGPGLGSCIAPDCRAIPTSRSRLLAPFHAEWKQDSLKKWLIPRSGKVHGILVSESKDVLRGRGGRGESCPKRRRS